MLSAKDLKTIKNGKGYRDGMPKKYGNKAPSIPTSLLH